MSYPPEYGPPRVTAYAYVYAHGLMDRYGTLEWLFEIGHRAAGEARWRGIEPMQVWEGGGQQWYWVHTWPEEIWASVIAALAREEKTAFADAATAQTDDGPPVNRPPSWWNQPAPGPYDPSEDVTLYPGPNGTQAGYDISY
jgi:hypothetical protein